MISNDCICVYCASSEHIDSVYKDAAIELGRLIAVSGHNVVCGGGKSGLMRCVIDGALQAGGKAIGVLPEFMISNDWQHERLSQLIVTEDMHTRKHRMAAMSAGAIALPGGCGTLEELLEIITWRQLNLFDGQIVILNTAGYYDPLLEMLGRTIDLGFMRSDHRKLWKVAATPAEAVGMVLDTDTNHYHFSQKIM